MHMLHKHVLSETRLEEVFSNIRKTLRLCVCTCRIKHIPQIIRKTQSLSTRDDQWKSNYGKGFRLDTASDAMDPRAYCLLKQSATLQ